MKKIVILGSTGSIGTQAIEVIERNRDAFEVVGIAAGGRDPGRVVAQARACGLGPGAVAVADPVAAREVSGHLVARC